MVHCYYRDLGGENLSFEAETRLLQESGVRVTTYTRDNREIDRVSPLGRVQIGLRTIWAEDAYRDLIDIVRRERPDVVHFQNTFPLISPSALQAVHRLGVPVVQALRNYRLMCASAVLFRDGHVCTDCVGKKPPVAGHPAWLLPPFTAADDRGRLDAGRSPGPRDLVGCGRRVRRPERVRPRPVHRGRPRPGARSRSSRTSSRPTRACRRRAGRGAIFAGRLAPEKGVLTILKAWRELPDIGLRIIGDGPMRRELERFIASEGLEDRVELMGHQPPERVLELLGESGCVIFPSEWYETFGRVAAEAFACGVPVVASRLGAMAEVVTDGQDGRLFEPGNAESLAAAVREVMSGDDHERLRQNARARLPCDDSPRRSTWSSCSGSTTRRSAIGGSRPPCRHRRGTDA